MLAQLFLLRVLLTLLVALVLLFFLLLLLWWVLASATDHHTQTWIGARHLSILLEESRVLDLRVTISELVLGRLSLTLVTVVLVLAIFLVLDD